ncbi:MAG: linear amide C-N hydrolase [Acidobacteria bacterium]|nr:linear amide C-N hydrolase [Acidobacteriota bacterium]
MRKTVAVLVALLAASPGFTCTTVVIPAVDGAVVAYNYEFHPSEGLVLVNKRGTSKRSRVDVGGAAWTSKFASVTFNQFGRDNPTTGMNEAGLMVSLMWLDGTKYPAADARPAAAILEWIQANLDTRGSVAEVVLGLEAIRPVGDTPIHYFFADASGDAAVVEFLKGRAVVHRGDSLPVKALANSTYEASIDAWREAQGKSWYRGRDGSLDRFVRGARRAAGEGDAVARGFAVLSDVAQPGFTRWSVVYDLRARVVHFKSDLNPEIRTVSLGAFDLSCVTPVQMLDVTARGSGDVRAQFRDYTRAANRALIEASFAKTPFLKETPVSREDALAAFPDEASTCSLSR